jgi:hypothetical protein
MADKEQIESKDVDVIVDYLISFRSANEVGDRRGALLVKHQQMSHRRRAGQRCGAYQPPYAQTFSKLRKQKASDRQVRPEKYQS